MSAAHSRADMERAVLAFQEAKAEAAAAPARVSRSGDISRES